jgi:hypothetical protein
MALELSGMVFERLGWKRLVKVQQWVSLPLVIAGVVLSIVHQSSLGSLYLIVPGKLHALWYSPMLPLLFFVSAVMAGLAMVIVESRLSSRALGRHLEMDLLADIGHVLAGVMVLYTGLRFYDLWDRGQVGSLFAFDYESLLALLEIGPFLLLPMVLLSLPKVRMNTQGLYVSALLPGRTLRSVAGRGGRDPVHGRARLRRVPPRRGPPARVPGGGLRGSHRSSATSPHPGRDTTVEGTGTGLLRPVQPPSGSPEGGTVRRRSRPGAHTCARATAVRGGRDGPT